jgi:DNA-binding HxlR family transcriptional regulator
VRSYGQFCPVARASEILAERWTPIIVRNLLLGCTTFNEIAAGAPGVPRALLTKRLRELQRAGVVEIRPKPAGRGSVYELTPAGRELWAVVQAMRDWGLKWLELAPAHTNPDVVLWSWCTTYLRRDLLPSGRVLVRFDFPEEPESRRRLWLLVQDGDAEVCAKPPGFEEDLVVTVNDADAFARWHLGLQDWEEAVGRGRLRMAGPRALARALPTWNLRVGTPRLPVPAQRAVPPGPDDVPVRRARSSPGIPGFSGRVVTPTDGNYETARRLWNGAVDRRPAYMPIAVRGGGHGVAGTAVCDDGVVVDLSAMKAVDVRPSDRRVRVEGGTLWGEVDAATQAFGLATTGGIVSHTGVAGLTLGGGIGWLMRRHGLTVDNLLAAELVTADGSRLTATPDEEPARCCGRSRTPPRSFASTATWRQRHHGTSARSSPSGGRLRFLRCRTRCTVAPSAWSPSATSVTRQRERRRSHRCATSDGR